MRQMGKLVAGHFPGVSRYPLVLGHESAGIVEAVGNKVSNFQTGQRIIGGLVFTLTTRNMPADGAASASTRLRTITTPWSLTAWPTPRTVGQRSLRFNVPFREDISVENAVLLCTWREVYGGFGDFHLQAGQDVLIFGAGPVGLSFVKFARLLGLGYIGVVETE